MKNFPVIIVRGDGQYVVQNVIGIKKESLILINELGEICSKLVAYFSFLYYNIIDNKTGEFEMKLEETRKEDDLYFVGPLWILGTSLNEINDGKFVLLTEKFLVDYEGKPVSKAPRSQYTHKGIWDSQYKKEFGTEYNYCPRGRVGQKQSEAYLNIPNGLNKEVIIPKIKREYDIKKDFALIKDTDPTTGNHYSFLLK